MKIVVLGAGAWGTAVAMSAAQHPAGHQVTLWARRPAQASAMQTQHENTHYLPGMALPPALQVASGDPVPRATAPTWSSWPPPWLRCAAC